MAAERGFPVDNIPTLATFVVCPSIVGGTSGTRIRPTARPTASPIRRKNTSVAMAGGSLADDGGSLQPGRVSQSSSALRLIVSNHDHASTGQWISSASGPGAAGKQERDD